MSKRKTKQGLPSLEDETQSPLPTLESKEGMTFMDEIALCRETQDNPLTSDDLGTEIIQIKVDKPKKIHFFRAMPPPEERGYLQVYMVNGAELSNVPKNWYVVTTHLVKALGEYGKPIRKFALVPTIDRDGNIRVWPHSLTTTGQGESWFNSRQLVIATAIKKWVSFQANNIESNYKITEARDQSLEPKWPLDLKYEDLIHKAVGDHYVTSLNHPVIRSLRGDSLHKVESEE